MSGTFTGTVSSASSTLLTDSNTFSGINLFTNASSNFDGTWQNLSPSAFAQFSYLFPNNATSTTLTFSGGLVSSASTTFSQLGTGLTGSNNGLLYGNIATTTASCSGTLACTSFAILGSSPITLTGSDTTIIPVSTSSVPTIGQLSYWTSAGTPSLLGSVATGTISASGGITATAGQSIIGSGLTIGCDVASGSVAGCLASADFNTFNGKLSSYDAWTHPSATQSATTSVMILTGGLVSNASSTFSTLGTGLVGVNNGLLYNSASTTFGVGLTYAAGAVTCNTASGSVFGCLASADWTTFNNKNGWAYPFTPTSYGNATSSIIGFTGGLMGTASSTFLSTLDLKNATVKQHLYPSFTTPATTTTWTATSTWALGTAYQAETWNSAECYTNESYLNVVFSDGTNNITLVPASSTPARFALTSNNSFTAGEKRYINVGTTTTSGAEYVTCTIDKTIN